MHTVLTRLGIGRWGVSVVGWLVARKNVWGWQKRPAKWSATADNCVYFVLLTWMIPFSNI